MELTPPLTSPARQPAPNDYRAAAGLSAVSCPPLLANALAYQIDGIRYPLDAGLRYGIRATIINPQGIPSHPFATTLTQALQ
ncbi:hypothetical protein HZA57_00575 [Candidatus Poribacteria bacterium]|nr:hypothetical protein [Candidatus Poribacteria bacterium]